MSLLAAALAAVVVSAERHQTINNTVRRYP